MDQQDNERIQERVDELGAHTGAEGLTTPELLAQMRRDAKELLKMELNLAKSEAKIDLESELDLAKGVALSAICALLGLNMLIVAAVFALAPHSAWMVALGVGVVLLLVAATAGFIGWRQAEKDPLSTTLGTLKEDMAWAKRQIKRQAR